MCPTALLILFRSWAQFYSQDRKEDIEPLRDLFYVRTEREAARHLFEVASAVDSAVLGETQILAQIKEAYSSACAVKTVGKVSHYVFHQAFRVGKQVRTHTELGRGACSVSSAAIDLLRAHLPQMDRPEVLFIGVNQMINLAASRLARLNVGRFVFANRTIDKAGALAKRYGHSGHGLNELPALLKGADIVISCTGSPDPVITSNMLSNAMVRRTDRPLLLIDLAIPRDIECGSVNHPAVHCADLEEIQRFAAEHQKQREAEIPQAELIIDQRLAEYDYWYSHVQHEQDGVLEESFEHIRRQELQDVLGKLPIELQNELNDASRHLVQKLLQVHTRLQNSSR